MTSSNASRQFKADAIDEAIELVVDKHGDIYPIVLERYLQEYPQAVSIFQEHGGNSVKSLEISMIEQTFYCLMTWYRRKTEVKGVLSTTVPHHEFLGIPLDIFSGLFRITFSVIRESLPVENENLTNIINELENELLVAVH